jgi:hypothetical protein
MKLHTIQNLNHTESTKKIFNESYEVKKSDCFPNIQRLPKEDDQCKEKERRKSSESLYKGKTEERASVATKKSNNPSKVSPMRRVDRFINI